MDVKAKKRTRQEKEEKEALAFIMAGEGWFKGRDYNGMLISRMQAEDMLADDKSEAGERLQHIQDLSDQELSEEKKLPDEIIPGTNKEKAGEGDTGFAKR